MHLLHSLSALLVVALGTLSAAQTVSVRSRTQGTFVGLSSNTGDQFFGIPYAQAPVGPLRFAKTRPLQSSTGVRQATQPAVGCLQAFALQNPSKYSEDCLLLNVFRPPASARRSALPVIVYIHGGSWQEDEISLPRYNAEKFVTRSVQLGEPVIFVTINYRLGAFGFLAGPDVDAADKAGTATLNPGYWDQRTALQWIKANIASFGGDAAKIALTGQSAGANGVAAQMLANGGRTEGLFRAAILQSGSQALAPRRGASDETPTNVYKVVLGNSQCTDLACLRALPATSLLVAQLQVPATTRNLINFLPVRDRFFATELPSAQFAAGRFPSIPIISGSVLDEGPLFSPTIAADDQTFGAVLQILGGPKVTPAIPQIMALYPDDPKVGSPFWSELTGSDPSDRFYDPRDTNQFKRLAATLGDVLINAGRRQQLRATTKRVNAWCYLFAQPDATLAINSPSLGIAHGSDIEFVFNQPNPAFTGAVTNSSTAAAARYANPAAIKRTADIMSAAWIHFATTLAPTGKEVPDWPRYGSQGRTLQIQGNQGTKLIFDDYRSEQIQYVLDNPAIFEN